MLADVSRSPRVCMCIDCMALISTIVLCARCQDSLLSVFVRRVHIAPLRSVAVSCVLGCGFPTLSNPAVQNTTCTQRIDQWRRVPIFFGRAQFSQSSRITAYCVSGYSVCHSVRNTKFITRVWACLVYCAKCSRLRTKERLYAAVRTRQSRVLGGS